MSASTLCPRLSLHLCPVSRVKAGTNSSPATSPNAASPAIGSTRSSPFREKPENQRRTCLRTMTRVQKSNPAHVPKIDLLYVQRWVYPKIMRITKKNYKILFANGLTDGPVGQVEEDPDDVPDVPGASVGLRHTQVHLLLQVAVEGPGRLFRKAHTVHVVCFIFLKIVKQHSHLVSSHFAVRRRPDGLPTDFHGALRQDLALVVPETCVRSGVFSNF